MTARLLRTDRVVTALLGLVLVGGGLLVLDWRYRLVFTGYSDALSTTAASDVVGRGWFTWAGAAVGLVLGLLALAWMLAHARRLGRSTLRLAASDERGRVAADLRAVAGAAASRLGALAPVTSVTGSTRVYRSRTVIELRGYVDPDADVAAITEAADRCASEILAAFPDDDVTCRVLVDGPRRRRARRDRPVRVH